MLIPGTYDNGIGNDSHAVLLIQSDTGDGDGNFVDASRGGSTHVISGHGGALHTTMEHKFGASSIYVTATRWQDTPDSADWTVCPGDWTVEAWVRMMDGSPNSVIIGQRISAGSDSSWALVTSSRRVHAGKTSNGSSWSWAITPANIQDHVWHHMVGQCRNGVLSAYLDGVRGPTTLGVSSIHESSLALTSGRTTDGARPLEGYLDEIRITKGLARYPLAGFTPPARMN